MKRNHINRPILPPNFSLESLKAQNSFRVPDGYFDDLPKQITERIKTNPNIIRSKRIHPGVFAAAASVIVLIGLTLVMRTSIFSGSTSMNLSSLPDTHIVNHLDSAIINGEIDEPILIEAVVKATSQNPTSASKEALTSDNAKAGESSTQVQSEATGILPTVTDEAIIDYLFQNETPTNQTNDIL